MPTIIGYDDAIKCPYCFNIPQIDLDELPLTLECKACAAAYRVERFILVDAVSVRYHNRYLDFKIRAAHFLMAELSKVAQEKGEGYISGFKDAAEKMKKFVKEVLD